MAVPASLSGTFTTNNNTELVFTDTTDWTAAIGSSITYTVEIVQRYGEATPEPVVTKTLATGVTIINSSTLNASYNLLTETPLDGVIQVKLSATDGSLTIDTTLYFLTMGTLESDLLQNIETLLTKDCNCNKDCKCSTVLSSSQIRTADLLLRGAIAKFNVQDYAQVAAFIKKAKEIIKDIENCYLLNNNC